MKSLFNDISIHKCIYGQLFPLIIVLLSVVSCSNGKNSKDEKEGFVIASINKQFIRYCCDSIIISVESNEFWHVSSSQSWLSLSDTSGYGNMQIIAYSHKHFDTPLNGIATVTIQAINSKQIWKEDIFCTDDCGLYRTHLTDSLVDCQGNIYPTIQAGELIWMAENLRCTAFDSNSEFYGTQVFAIGEFDETQKDLRPCYSDGRYVVNEQNLFCEHQSKYGLLYNTNCIAPEIKEIPLYQSQLQGICPNGWHVPNEYEVQHLIDYVGGLESSVSKLRSKDDWIYEDINLNVGNDCIGFNLYPSGVIYGMPDSIDLKGFIASIWYIPMSDREGYWGALIISNTNADMYRNYSDKSLRSIRCVKNDSITGNENTDTGIF